MFLLVCLVAAVAVAGPFVLPDPKLAHSMVKVCVFGFAVQMLAVWLGRKWAWQRFLLQRVRNHDPLLNIVPVGGVFGPSLSLTFEGFRLPLLGLLLTPLVGTGLVFCFPNHRIAGVHDLTFIVWVYTFSVAILLNLTLFPAISLAEAVYWWLVSRRFPGLLCHVIALFALAVFWSAYVWANITFLGNFPESNPSSFFSGYFYILGFLGVFGLLMGVCWWLGLWLGQILLLRSENALRERFGLPSYSDEAISPDTE